MSDLREKKTAQTEKNEMTESAEKNFPAYSHLPLLFLTLINPITPPTILRLMILVNGYPTFRT